MPFRDAARRVFWSLPHDPRRTFLKVVRPARAAELARIRATFLKCYDQLECLFVHIPKTAGISIGTAVFGKAPSWHLSVRSLQLMYGRREYERYFKFAFVRNPWDRVRSAFAFLRAGGAGQKDVKWRDANILESEDLSGFVSRWMTPDSVRSAIHFIPQVDFLRSAPGKPVEMDFVGRFESLHADFQVVKDRLGIDAVLDHRNPGPVRSAKDYRGDFTSEAARIVEEVYAGDIRAFGYRFD